MNNYNFTIEWPEINFDEFNHLNVENKIAGTMYKAIIALLIVPEIVIKAFYEVLKFKG
jgi:hypothetical protein